ncbi:MAG TPA: ABC transporter permease [Bryobacteraceae bacterium]
MKDVRYALRMLAKSPGFTALAVLTLALGIGANTAIFTVANALLLRPLPFADPNRLALIGVMRSQLTLMSYLRFTAIREQNHSFSGIATVTTESFNFSGRGDAEEVPSARTTWNFFDVLGVRPVLGRTFVVSDDEPGGKQVALITHSFWTARFGGSPDIVGQNITLDLRDYTVIGVLPADFSFSYLGPRTDIWATRVYDLNLISPSQVQRGAGFLTAIARLRKGVTRDQAQAEMAVLNRQFSHANPGRPDSDPRIVIEVTDLRQHFVENFRSALLMLLGAVGLVLLIACANVASLLLSRALGRRKEIAIRAAIGASRGVLLRQLIIESLMLAGAGGIAGTLLGLGSTRMLSALAARTLPRFANLHVDGAALAFTAAISVASGLFFGLVPSLQLSKPDLNAVLRDEGRGSAGNRRRNNGRNILVVSQVALSMVLLVGAGLFIRSFIRLQTATPGFDPQNVLSMRISLPPTKYPGRPQMIAFYHEAMAQLRTLPGVESVAISSALPVKGTRRSPMLIEGQPVVPIGEQPMLNIQAISPDYTKVLRVPLVRGREFTEHDGADAPPVVMVNQALVRRYWPNENPIGKRIYLGTTPQAAEVAGVLGDIKNENLMHETTPEVFVPFPQLPWPSLNLTIRTTRDPHNSISAVRRQISRIDKDQPVTNVQTLEELLDTASAQPRFTMLLLGIFASTALILAVVGIYGVIAYSVAQRTQELGIRLALGAAKSDILRLVLGHGLLLALSGVALGTIASVALTRVLSSMLYKTSATDPTIFSISAVLFLVAALIASYLPARRAMRIDPTDALRCE